MLYFSDFLLLKVILKSSISSVATKLPLLFLEDEDLLFQKFLLFLLLLLSLFSLLVSLLLSLVPLSMPLRILQELAILGGLLLDCY